MRTQEDWLRFSNPVGIIRLVLLVDWDPIGIFGHPRAMDEYDRYALEVFDLLQTGVRGIPSLAAVVEKLFVAYSAALGVQEEQHKARF